jgi:hypothetical protein
MKGRKRKKRLSLESNQKASERIETANQEEPFPFPQKSGDCVPAINTT